MEVDRFVRIGGISSYTISNTSLFTVCGSSLESGLALRLEAILVVGTREKQNTRMKVEEAALVARTVWGLDAGQ